MTIPFLKYYGIREAEYILDAQITLKGSGPKNWTALSIFL